MEFIILDQFDENYYILVLESRGILILDLLLFINVKIGWYVMEYVNNRFVFFECFIVVMFKMGCVGVKLGLEGEI